LAEAIGLVREQLRDVGYDLDRMKTTTGFDKLKALKDAKELINTNDETRKGFEITARAVFRKYKACLTFARVESINLTTKPSTTSTARCKRTRPKRIQRQSFKN
jgi:type I restriction enzyme R subunit